MQETRNFRIGIHLILKFYALMFFQAYCRWRNNNYYQFVTRSRPIFQLWRKNKLKKDRSAFWLSTILVFSSETIKTEVISSSQKLPLKRFISLRVNIRKSLCFRNLGKNLPCSQPFFWNNCFVLKVVNGLLNSADSSNSRKLNPCFAVFVDKVKHRAADIAFRKIGTKYFALSDHPPY